MNFKKSLLLILASLSVAVMVGASDSFKPVTTKVIRGGDEAEHLVVDISGVKDLWLLATSGPDDYHSDRAAWGDPVLIDMDGNRVDLTKIKPASVKVGWGQLIIDAGLGSKPLKIGTKAYEHALFAHAPSALHFQLDGKFKTFEAYVGIGAGAGKNGSSEFRVLAKYDDTRMQEYPKGRPEEKPQVGTGFNPVAMEMAIKDMTYTWPDRFTDSAKLLEELASLKGEDSNSEKCREFQRRVLLRNPLLDFDKLLFIRRNEKNIGLPANWQSNSCLPKNGYSNELAVMSMKTPGEVKSLLSPANGAFIGDLDLHFNADRFLYSSIGTNGAWQVFEANIDGSGVRQVTATIDPSINNYDACYLPDGRIMFTSTAPKVAVPCVNGSSPVANIFRCNLDGSDMEQLCFDQEHGWCPQVMEDGRILFLRWEYADLPHSNSRILMTMNPDGTNQRSHYGSNSFWPNGVFYARPIPGHQSMFAGIITGHHGVRRMGELVLFDVARGYMEADGAVQKIPGYGQKVEPIVRDGLANGASPMCLHPFPLSEKYFLVSAQVKGYSGWGIFLMDIFDNITLTRNENGYALLEPVPLVKVSIPPVIPDKIDNKRSDAVVFISDIYEGPGLKDIPRGEVKKLRLFSYTYGYTGMGGLYGVIGLDGPWDMRRMLGTVPVEEDGSAVFRVPANIPISIQPLDSEDKALQLMRSWFVARPGENLSCVGCHEDPKQTPPVKISKAARKGPAEITPWLGPVRNFEFEREVQPVLDKYCLSCHGGTNSAVDYRMVEYKAKLIPCLRGDVKIHDWNTVHAGRGGGGNYSVSYFNLYRYGRHPGEESEMPLLTPMEFHADTCELIMMLEKGHHGVKPDREAIERIVTWLDINAPYHGRWSTVRGEKAQSNEDIRASMRKLYSNVDENHENMPAAGNKDLVSVVPDQDSFEKLRLTGKLDFISSVTGEKKGEPMEVELGDGVKMVFVHVPAGEFTMGSAEGYIDELPMSKVVVSKGFWMGKYEVSNSQFSKYAPEHNSRHEDRHGYQFGVTGYPVNEPDMPAVRLSWNQAMDFCDWLSKKSARKVMLPTEAQWEWACRAGTGTPMNYGGVTDDFAAHGNMGDITLSAFSGNPYQQDWRTAQYNNATNIYDNWIPQIGTVNDGGFISEPVGKYKANAWGLHDMHGNVAEWTRSLYRMYPYNDNDGRNSVSGVTGRHVVRGGSWYDRPKLCTSSFRRPYRDYQKVYNVGFRVIIED